MLGEYLRSLRRASGVRAADAYLRLGVPKPTFYWWEGPRSRIDPVDIRRLLELYGCSDEEITTALDIRSRVSTPEVQT